MADLTVTGLTKRFGGIVALDGVSLSVKSGEIVGLIGPNGAGKTTVFNLITGMQAPDSGEILFEGETIIGLTPDVLTRRGIARTFQNVRVFANMTVLENVMVAQHCRTSKGAVSAIFRTAGFRREEEEIRERAAEVLSFFGTRLVGYRFDQPAFMLSYANRRRLEIARAIATQPKVVLLDEPTAGMNPSETREMTELIGRLRDDRGITVVVIEHEMKVVRDVSDRVVVLDHGEQIAEGSYEEVTSDENVIEAYLGRPARAH